MKTAYVYDVPLMPIPDESTLWAHVVLKEAEEIRLLGYDEGVGKIDETWDTFVNLVDPRLPDESWRQNFRHYESDGVLGVLLDGQPVYIQIMCDQSDGYRSSFGAGVVRTQPEEAVFQFQHAPPLVRFEEVSQAPDPSYYHDDNDSEPTMHDVRGFRLVDARDGHVWMEWGTDEYDSYYPSFYARFNPKKPEEE